ncbi:MAG TPA: gephyrin-like molybdotransferase Glp [Thermodesulfobacteriota bacterium]|nr:gephyrin-like molybdotransferase Glp [Thermodesulfobacteriota bacterium]
MISVEDALRLILDTAPLLGLEKVDILTALGRVIGENIYSPSDIPPFDNSAMDGYAVKSEDTKDASIDHPAVLMVIEDLPAGYVAKGKIKKGEAIRIMTGAPLPEGVDSVVMVEDTEASGDKVKIFNEAETNQHIRKAGEDVKKGELVIPQGTVLRPAAIGMLASLKRSFVSVYQRPLVSILCTGDELVDVDGELKAGQIVSSNSYTLASQVNECGGIPLLLGIARDRKDELEQKFREGLRADVIISSAGVSVGDYDLVKGVLKDLGMEMKFWKVAMRPGQPLAFGTIGGKPTFGLPGNPVSSMVSFEQFVRPYLLKMQGHKKIFRPVIEAIWQEGFVKKTERKYLVRCMLSKKEGTYIASSTGEQGSGILKSMVLANGLAIFPEEKEVIKAGEKVKVQLLDREAEQQEVAEY